MLFQPEFRAQNGLECGKKIKPFNISEQNCKKCNAKECKIIKSSRVTQKLCYSRSLEA